jgi:hypothetical protein
MLTIHDINIIESEDADEVEYFQAVQRAINSGSAWSLQGSYGRTMMQAIVDGYCILGKNSTRDYYGNHIPSRFDVQPGSVGSREFVANAQGEEWASEMEAV